MTKREKCRCITTFLTVLLGVAGAVLLIYGGVKMFKVSLDSAKTDNVNELLSGFISCSDVADAAPTGQFDNHAVYKAIKHQCRAEQVPSQIAIGFAGAFVLLAVLSAPCAFKRNDWFRFGLYTALAISCTLMAVLVVGIQALPVATTFVDCKQTDDATIAEFSKLGFVCFRQSDANGNVNTKSSVAYWYCKLHMFCCGAAMSFVSLILLLIIRRCSQRKCCGPEAAVAGAEQSGCHGGANGQPRCIFRRCFARLRSRLCSRNAHVPLASDADVPVSAPSYYDVSGEGAVASEDAGASQSDAYRAYSVQ